MLHLCEGVGWEGISGAIEVEMLPRPANVPFVQSLYFYSFFFFKWIGTRVNFLFSNRCYVTWEERVSAPAALSLPSLHSSSSWAYRNLTSLSLSPEILKFSPLAAAPYPQPLSPSLFCIRVSVHRFSKHKAVFTPGVGGNKRLCTYFVCV